MKNSLKFLMIGQPGFISFYESETVAEPTREVSDPARFWGLAQAKSEGWTKCRIQPDVKSTSHQNIGAPEKRTCKGKLTRDRDGTIMEGVNLS